MYHYENLWAFKKFKVQKNQLDIIWRSNNKAWITHILFTEWIIEIFGTAVKEYILEKNLPLKVLPFIDNAPDNPAGLGDNFTGGIRVHYGQVSSSKHYPLL